MTYFVKALGKDVLDESPEESDRVQRGRVLAFRPKGYVSRHNVKQTRIGNTDPVGIRPK